MAKSKHKILGVALLALTIALSGCSGAGGKDASTANNSGEPELPL